MHIEYVGINISVTKAMREKLDRTISKLSRYLHDTDTIKLSFSVDGIEQKVSGVIFLPEHKTVHVEASSENMYQSIDMLQEKLLRQLRRVQRKKIDRKQKNTIGKDLDRYEFSNDDVETDDIFGDDGNFELPFC